MLDIYRGGYDFRGGLVIWFGFWELSRRNSRRHPRGRAKSRAPPSRRPRASERTAVLIVFDAIDYFSGDLVVREGSSEFRTLRFGRVASSVTIFVVAWLYGLIFEKLRGGIAALGLPGGTALPVLASSGCSVDYYDSVN